MVDKNLREYVEKEIFPLYDNNFIGDGKDRIEYVLNRSKKIVQENSLEIDENILYTVICYHDIRKNNEEDSHELVSADIMYEDIFLKEFYTEEQRLLMKEAIEDQRASKENEPRNIYGKILSSASRNSSIEQCLERSYKYGKKKKPKATDEELFERAYESLLNKFGENGYAKFYFRDSVYEKFLHDIRELLRDKEKFIEKQRDYILNMK